MEGECLNGITQWVNFIGEAWVLVVETPLICSLIHFLLSALVSWPAFYLFSSHSSTVSHHRRLMDAVHEARLKALEKAMRTGVPVDRQQDRSYSIYERKYLVPHILVTGLAAAAIIEIQFSGTCQVPWAIIYGILGPYALRNLLLSFIGEKEKQALHKDIRDVSSPKDSVYQSEVEELIESALMDAQSAAVREGADGGGNGRSSK